VHCLQTYMTFVVRNVENLISKLYFALKSNCSVRITINSTVGTIFWCSMVDSSYFFMISEWEMYGYTDVNYNYSACACVRSVESKNAWVCCRLSTVVSVTNRLLDKCVHSMIFRYFLLTFVDNVIRFGSAMRMLTALLTVFF
jgi:hypothetical protein